MIKLLIFDLDGTLADTGQDITDAVNYALDPVLERKYTVDEIKAMVGSGISNLLKSLIPEDRSLSEEELISRQNSVIDRFTSFYAAHLLDNTVAYPYVKETLPKLGGYRKVVLSNKRKVYSDKVVEGIGLSDFFDFVYGGDSLSEKKPSPVPVVELLKKEGVNKEDALMIGDSNYDVRAGKSAGLTVIAVTYGFRKKEELEGADFFVDSFDELPGLITKI